MRAKVKEKDEEGRGEMAFSVCGVASAAAAAAARAGVCAGEWDTCPGGLAGEPDSGAHLTFSAFSFHALRRIAKHT